MKINKRRSLEDNRSLSKDAWLRVLSVLYGVDVEAMQDSIAIDFEALNSLLTDPFDARDVRLLQWRYGDRMTWNAAGELLRRKDNTGPLSGEITRCLDARIFRRLRMPFRMTMIRSAIVPEWRLKMPPII